MNPTQHIAPEMGNNEALRRLLSVFMDANGNLLPGSPAGPVMGLRIGTTMKHVATGPLPVTAFALVPADDTRVGGELRNLDSVNTIYYGSDPNVTDTTGGSLLPKEHIQLNVRGAVYIYCTAGAPIAEFTPVYNQ
jgi:hypothetical protein